jgi:hypothetical protein
MIRDIGLINKESGESSGKKSMKPKTIAYIDGANLHNGIGQNKKAPGMDGSVQGSFSW